MKKNLKEVRGSFFFKKYNLNVKKKIRGKIKKRTRNI